MQGIHKVYPRPNIWMRLGAGINQLYYAIQHLVSILINDYETLDDDNELALMCCIS